MTPAVDMKNILFWGNKDFRFRLMKDPVVASLKTASSRWADRFVMGAKWPGVADHVRITSGLRLFQWICNFWIPRWQGGIILGLASNCGHSIVINNPTTCKTVRSIGSGHLIGH